MFGIRSLTLLALAALSAADIINEEWAAWESRGQDEDLWKFVSRPDLTPPKLEVIFHKPERAAPGYIFVGPYDCLDCGRRATTTYVTQQIGPTIYTADGEVVWSGKDLFPDRKVFDFRPVMIDGSYHLALVTPQDSEWHVFADGAAILLNASYDVVSAITSEDLGHRIDLHEFNVIEDGRKALISAKSPREDLHPGSVDYQGRIMEIFFMEVDLQTQEQLFRWRASDHVDLLESSNPPPDPDSEQKHWDWFHLNSIDKDANGDYLVSARATNTIYLISGKDGSVIWRLGGSKSSFMQDFVFSRQHHARIRRQTAKHMTISFFDNAADDSGEWEPTSETSSLLIVELDLENKVAKLNHRHRRPDGGHSLAKGNVEYLPNGNILGGWGENAYVSEYSKPGGDLVYEAAFASQRFANYRTYKADFVGKPSTKPDLKAFAGVNSRATSTTAIYVSWNGATEVAEWRFFAHNARSDDGTGVRSALQIGNATKTGFETSFVATGYHPIVFAEAVNVFGETLGRSALSVTELPLGFHDEAAPIFEPRMQSSTSEHLVAYTGIAFVAGITFTVFWNSFLLWKQGAARRRAGWTPIRKAKTWRK